jgi:hypothetical protein
MTGGETGTGQAGQKQNAEPLENRVISGDKPACVEYVARAICYARPTCQYCITQRKCLADLPDLMKSDNWAKAKEALYPGQSLKEQGK